MTILPSFRDIALAYGPRLFRNDRLRHSFCGCYRCRSSARQSMRTNAVRKAGGSNDALIAGPLYPDGVRVASDAEAPAACTAPSAWWRGAPSGWMPKRTM